VGEDHNVTATVTPFIWEPVVLSFIDVEFAVSRAHVTTGSGIPIGGGQFTFTYTGINSGDDTITATASGFLYDSHNACILVYYTGSNTAEATKHWTMFVVPENPIGAIA
jgi:hypothetical protein